MLGRTGGMGSDEDLDSAARYRQPADELRAIAESTKDNEARKTLLDIADEYDQMALTRERIDRMDHERDR